MLFDLNHCMTLRALLVEAGIPRPMSTSVLEPLGFLNDVGGAEGCTADLGGTGMTGGVSFSLVSAEAAFLAFALRGLNPRSTMTVRVLRLLFLPFDSGVSNDDFDDSLCEGEGWAWRVDGRLLTCPVTLELSDATEAPPAELSEGTRDGAPLACWSALGVPNIFPRPSLSTERPFLCLLLLVELVRIVSFPACGYIAFSSCVTCCGVAGPVTATVGGCCCALRMTVGERLGACARSARVRWGEAEGAAGNGLARLVVSTDGRRDVRPLTDPVAPVCDAERSRGRTFSSDRGAVSVASLLEAEDLGGD